MSRLASERRLAVLRGVLLVAIFTLAPSRVPEWRTGPAAPPAAVLPVGEPTRMLTRETPEEDLW